MTIQENVYTHDPVQFWFNYVIQTDVRSNRLYFLWLSFMPFDLCGYCVVKYQLFENILTDIKCSNIWAADRHQRTYIANQNEVRSAFLDSV